MLIKVSELEGKKLSWAVAQVHPLCEGLEFGMIEGIMCGYYIEPETKEKVVCIFMESNSFRAIKARKKFKDAEWFEPTVGWGQAGVVLEKFKNLTYSYSEPTKEWICKGTSDSTTQTKTGYSHEQKGPTLQIALLRCFIAAHLGELIEVPDELAVQ